VTPPLAAVWGRGGAEPPSGTPVGSYFIIPFIEKEFGICPLISDTLVGSGSGNRFLGCFLTDLAPKAVGVLLAAEEGRRDVPSAGSSPGDMEPAIGGLCPLAEEAKPLGYEVVARGAVAVEENGRKGVVQSVAQFMSMSSADDPQHIEANPTLDPQTLSAFAIASGFLSLTPARREVASR